MSYEILQGDCLQTLKTLPSGIVLLDIFAGDVLTTMYPSVASATKSNEVINVESKGRISRPRLDMVGVESAPSFAGRVATLASVIISFVNCSENFFPLARRIQSLAFWCAAIDIVRVALSRSARHAIGFATNPGFFSLRFLAQYLARFICVSLAKKGRGCSRLLQVVIFIRQVFSTQASGYAVANKPVIDLLMIAIDQLANVISTQLFNEILLPKPSFVNGLLGFLPFALASQRTEAGGLSAAPDNFNTALLTI